MTGVIISLRFIYSIFSYFINALFEALLPMRNLYIERCFYFLFLSSTEYAGAVLLFAGYSAVCKGFTLQVVIPARR